eukprot:11300836-Karenia_brevis.AAC.1
MTQSGLATSTGQIGFRDDVETIPGTDLRHLSVRFALLVSLNPSQESPTPVNQNGFLCDLETM